jgi:hypothetical protein
MGFSLTRRSFLGTIATALGAIGASRLPPVRSISLVNLGSGYLSPPTVLWTCQEELSQITRKAFLPRIYVQVMKELPCDWQKLLDIENESVPPIYPEG